MAGFEAENLSNIKQLKTMLEGIKVDEILGDMGRFSQIPLIDIIREQVKPIFLYGGFQETEFKSLLTKLGIAEGKGTSRKERLQQEIEEWADILDDDQKTHLYNMGNNSVLEAFALLASGDDDLFGILRNLKDNIEYVTEDSEDDEADIFSEEIENWMANINDPEYIENIEKNLSPEIKLLLVKSEEEMTTTDLFKIVMAHCNFSDGFIKITRKLAKEILLVHSQMEYYQRIVDYRDEHFSIIQSEDDPTDKKISIPYPKVIRSPNDKITSLTSNQTTYLFSLLRGHGIIIKEKNYQPASNISLAIKAITGYNEQNIRVNLDKVENIDKYDKIVVKEKIEDLLKQINRHLQ